MTQGIQSFIQNITNINQITPNFVNTLVDNPGLNQILIYPPPSIPLNIWNSNQEVMKTVKSIFVMILFFIISSCSTVSKLQGNKYTYKSKQRTLELVFTDGATCVLKNTFHCPDVEEKYRIISTECNYTKKGDTIFISNKNKFI